MSTAMKEQLKDVEITPWYFAFIRAGGELERIGEKWDEMPTNFDKDLEVIVAKSFTMPLQGDGTLMKGVEATINPHRSESPFTYTT